MVNGKMMNVEEPAPPDTLSVRRLPDELTERDLNELFCGYFGALQVKRENRLARKCPTVYIKFQTHEDAHYAMNRLHQLVIKGKRIVVEYANFTFLQEPKCEKFIQQEPDHNWNYPPASETIVKRISNMMLKNENFYQQVIQLMKSMHLPPPFSTHEKPVDHDEIEEVEMEELYKEETEESELEADDSTDVKEIIPQLPVKRKKVRQMTRKHKIVSVLHKPKEPTSETSLAEVFERPQVQTEKKLQVRISARIPEGGNEVPLESQADGFGKFTPAPTSEDKSEVPMEEPAKEENVEFISKVKLSTNIITPDEMKLLPVFKNYLPGEPNSRLYLKNLAKGTKEDDLKFIYGRYVVWTSEEERNMFDIRLMTEGRMKGQAFITLPSVKRAEQALKETNGYVLNGKPLVVHFARSAQVKPQTA